MTATAHQLAAPNERSGPATYVLSRIDHLWVDLPPVPDLQAALDLVRTAERPTSRVAAAVATITTLKGVAHRKRRGGIRNLGRLARSLALATSVTTVSMASVAAWRRCLAELKVIGAIIDERNRAAGVVLLPSELTRRVLRVYLDVSPEERVTSKRMALNLVGGRAMAAVSSRATDDDATTARMQRAFEASPRPRVPALTPVP